MSEQLLGPLGLLIGALLVIGASLLEHPLWVPGRSHRRELAQCRADCARALAEKDAQIVREREEAARTIAEWQARAGRWEQAALNFTDLGAVFARIAEADREARA